MNGNRMQLAIVHFAALLVMQNWAYVLVYPLGKNLETSARGPLGRGP